MLFINRNNGSKRIYYELFASIKLETVYKFEIWMEVSFIYLKSL